MREFRTVSQDRTGCRMLVLKKDVVGRDNCWNCPRPVNLAVGTQLRCSESHSGSDGVLFFQIAGTHQSVQLPRDVFNTRYPHDLGEFNPEYLEEVVMSLAPYSASAIRS